MDRIYIIQYKLYESKNGAFKYAISPEYVLKTEFFSKHERDTFIDRYKYLASTDRDLYIADVKCYTAIPDEIADMEVIINGI